MVVIPTSRNPLPTILRQLLCAAIALTALGCAMFVHAEPQASSGGLQTIDNPGGGQVVYGSLTNVTSQRDAMAAMLRNVHGHFGDRPVIGKFFQAKGSDSIATFFQLTAKNPNSKPYTGPIAGMVIVDLPTGAKSGSAAVLYDDAAHFRKSQPALMKALNAAWHKESPRSSSASSNNPAFAAVGNGPGGVFGVNIAPDQSLSQPLHLAAVPDNSATIGLPEGWTITSGSGGSLHAAGPKGESLHMGVIFGNNYDPQTQQGASMIAYMRRGSTPFTACPMANDLIADFECISTQNRKRMNLPPITMHVVSSKFMPNDRMQGAFLLETDFNDGKGPMMTSLRLGAQRMGPGNWMMTAGQANVPRSLADQEWPTIQAMIMSYRQNSAVIQQQTRQVIDQINARAAANRQLADARSHANDVHNAAVDAQWDQQARQNKAFENYTLDYAVLHDPSDGGSWGRATYPTAEFLVQAAPDRFQYAQTQDLLQGIDY